jgi:hypothetical protein
MAGAKKQTGGKTAGGIKHPAGGQFTANGYYFSDHSSVCSFSLFAQSIVSSNVCRQKNEPSANMLLPTIDAGARQREMAFKKHISYLSSKIVTI